MEITYKDPSTGETKKGYSAGTLGLIVLNKRTGNRAILSNHHVLYGDNGKVPVGTPVSQPVPTDPPEEGGEYQNVCARLTDGYYGNFLFKDETGIEKPYNVDAAIADLIKDDTGKYRRSSIPAVKGKEIYSTVIPAENGRRVWKMGAETGLTFGHIRATDFSAFDNLQNAIVIEGEGKKPFAEHGDSGSIVVDDQSKKIVGLLRSGPPMYPTLALACHIVPVIAKLDLFILYPEVVMP